MNALVNTFKSLFLLELLKRVGWAKRSAAKHYFDSIEMEQLTGG